MRFTSSFLASIALAIACGTGALAAPWAQDAKHTTHSVRAIKPGFTLASYHPEPSFEARIFLRGA
jgi:extracellular elastinolytic metalloproteinase